MKNNKKMNEKEVRIKKLLCSLSNLGNMTPGKLSVQYRIPKERKNPFYQLSWTINGKGRSAYIRPECVKMVETETREFRKFKKTIEKIIELSMEASALRREKTLDKTNTTKNN